MIVRQGMTLTAMGVATGLAGAWLATRWMRALLFGVSTFDPLTYGAVTLLLALVALGACYLPARRAARTDPLIALRYE
jgi:putative ABC transport system permease protein